MKLRVSSLDVPRFSALYQATKPEGMSLQQFKQKNKDLKGWFTENTKGDIYYRSVSDLNNGVLYIVTSDNATPTETPTSRPASIYEALLDKIKEMGLHVQKVPIPRRFPNPKEAAEFVSKTIWPEFQRQKQKESGKPSQVG